MRLPTARRTRGALALRRLALLAALLAGAGGLPPEPAAAQPTTWQGGAGVWSDPDNWDPDLPTATSQVLIDDGNATASDVALDTFATINALSLDADDLLRIQNGQRLHFDGAGASLENHGLIQHEGTGFTSLRVLDDLAVTGTGTVRLNGGSNQVSGGFSSTLDHGPDHTIEGAGSVGSGIDVVNRGLIHGNVNGSSLTIQSQNTFENNGIVRASNGATVNMFSNDNTGSGGRYEAVGPGSRVVFFSNTEIHDAVFAGTGGGVITPDAFNLGRTMDLHDGVNEGRFDAADTFLHGSFTNSGTVRLLNAQTLSLESAFPLTGGGSIELVQGGDITGAFPLNNVDNTLAGFGDVDVAATFGAASSLAPGTSSDATHVLDFNEAVSIAGLVALDLAGVEVANTPPDAGQVNTGSPGTAIQFDQLNAFATATLEDAVSLDVDLVDGYTPMDGDFFDVLTADEIAVAGTLDLDLPSVPGVSFSHAILELFDPLAGTDRDVLRITARVPEPGAALLLALGLAAAARGRRIPARRRRPRPR